MNKLWESDENNIDDTDGIDDEPLNGFKKRKYLALKTLNIIITIINIKIKIETFQICVYLRWNCFHCRSKFSYNYEI